MKNFRELYESAIEDRLERAVSAVHRDHNARRPERTVRLRLAYASMDDAKADVDEVEAVVEAIDRAAADWHSGRSSSQASLEAGRVRRSWSACVSSWSAFVKSFALVSPQAMKVWTDRMRDMVHNGQLSLAAHRSPRPPVTSKKFPDLVHKLMSLFPSGGAIMAVGTPHYMSPEQGRGEDHDREYGIASRVKMALSYARQEQGLSELSENAADDMSAFIARLSVFFGACRVYAVAARPAGGGRSGEVAGKTRAGIVAAPTSVFRPDQMHVPTEDLRARR